MAAELGPWLQAIGLGEHLELFRQHGVDLDIVGELSEDDLVALGLPLGDRKRLIRAVATLDPKAPAERRASTSTRASFGAERRYLTVVFCDLVGSTDLANRLDPEEAGVLIGRFLRVVFETLARFGGHTEQLLGDGVLAYFGWPRAYEDQVERAVAAGLEVVQEVARLEGERELPLRCRVGIATGSVVVGELIGQGGPWDTIAGSAPNLAARLQAVAAPQQVLVDAATRKQLGGDFLVEPIPALDLKGFPQPIQAWRVLGALPRETRFAAHSPRKRTMIGRQSELALLLDGWRHASRGAGRVIMLCGEPGIGKSRLLEALVEKIDPGTITCLRYQCAALHSDTPLYPFLQQMSRALGFAPGDDRQVRREKLAAAIGAAFPEDPSAIARFAALFALSAPDADATEPPAVQRRRTIDGLVTHLLRMAKQRPVLMLFEDIQWADPSSEQVLRLAIEQSVDVPALLVITSREPFAPNWFLGSHVGGISLVRLDREESAALVRAATAEPLDEPTVQGIAERGDGIPLFLEEMTKCVAEDRFSAPRSGELPARSTLALPNSLQASLSSRLDHLGAAKRAAQVGAIIGREFSITLLAEVLQQNPPELVPDLDRLVQSGLVAPCGRDSHAGLRFKHALVHEAAYGSLLIKERKRLHGLVLQGYEKLFPGELQAMAQVLALHATQSERWDKAAHYLGLAYANAVNRSANREAISIFNRAIEALGKLPPDEAAARAIDLRLHAFTAFHTVGDNDKLVALVGEAGRLAELIGDQRRQAAAATQTAFALWMEGKHREAQSRAEAALALTRSPRDFPIVVSTLFNLANIRHAQGDIAEAVALDRRVLSMLTGDLERKRLGHAAPLGLFARAFASWFLVELGEFAQAAEMLEAAEPMITAAEPHGRVIVDTSRGNFLMQRGEFARAADVLRGALELSHRAEVLTMYPIVAAWLGHALCGAGRRDEALAVLSDAVERETYRFGGKYTWIHLRIALAEACRLAGQFERAGGEAELGRRIAEECGEVVHHAYAVLEQARIALACGDPNSALRQAEVAIAAARPRGLRPFTAECLDVTAQAHQSLNRPDASATALAEADAIRARLGLVTAGSSRIRRREAHDEAVGQYRKRVSLVACRARGAA
jgi:class 3 adenylate cyclase/tetratricopeptide (TPR) repeat protein